MTCKNVCAQLSSYLDGELSGYAMLDMRYHLNACPNYMEELDQERDIKWAVANMPEAEPSQGFADRLKATIFEAERRARRRMPLAMISSLAFVAALLISLAALRPSQPHAVTRQITQHTDQTTFDLSRDQAYQAGGDAFNDGSSIITVSASGDGFR